MFRLSRDAHYFSNGGPCWRFLHDRLEEQLARPVVPLANASLGLTIALRALVPRVADTRRKVALPSFTFAATAAATVWAGFEPLFSDVEPGSWQLSPTDLARTLADHGKELAAVVATSTFGTPAPASVLQSWVTCCREAGVPLIIDSAAALGIDFPPPFPDAQVFSMHATKPIPAGEGGVVATSSARDRRAN